MHNDVPCLLLFFPHIHNNTESILQQAAGNVQAQNVNFQMSKSKQRCAGHTLYLYQMIFVKWPRPSKSTQTLIPVIRSMLTRGQMPCKLQYPIRRTTEFGINISGEAPSHCNQGRLKSLPQLSFGTSMITARITRPVTA